MKEIALNGLTMNRRNFVKTAAATVAALGAGTALYGCDSRMTEAAEVIGHAAPTPEGAEWKTLACLHGCGQRCMNQCLVKDGIVLRQKTDDTHEPMSCFWAEKLHDENWGCFLGITTSPLC